VGLIPGLQRIGVTGGIGSGKSTVARMLAQCGAQLIDLDAVSRSLTAPGGLALAPLRVALGAAFFDADGALDRAYLRAQTFADPQTKARLEAVLHPLIMAQCDAQADVALAHQPVIFDIPLLAESPQWQAKVERIVVVECSPELQVTRVMQRSGWSRAAVLAVIAQQASPAQRRACADAIISNDGVSLLQLQAQVEALWGRWFGV
jgi:dephospho-CoA kinase